jgi:hypothetical protein
MVCGPCYPMHPQALTGRGMHVRFTIWADSVRSYRVKRANNFVSVRGADFGLPLSFLPASRAGMQRAVPDLIAVSSKGQPPGIRLGSKPHTEPWLILPMLWERGRGDCPPVFLPTPQHDERWANCTGRRVPHPRQRRTEPDQPAPSQPAPTQSRLQGKSRGPSGDVSVAGILYFFVPRMRSTCWR